MTSQNIEAWNGEPPPHNKYILAIRTSGPTVNWQPKTHYLPEALDQRGYDNPAFLRPVAHKPAFNNIQIIKNDDYMAVPYNQVERFK